MSKNNFKKEEDQFDINEFNQIINNNNELNISQYIKKKSSIQKNKNKNDTIVAIQADNLESLNYSSDTSLFIANGLNKKGILVFWYVPNTLCFSNGDITAKGYFIKVQYKAFYNMEIIEKSEEQEISLLRVSLVIMRQDPPFDMSYFTFTFFLEVLELNGVNVVNSPKSVRNMPEKLMHFLLMKNGIIKKSNIPESIITSNIEIMIEFIKCFDYNVILKPLYNFGGNDVLLISDELKKYSNNNQKYDDIDDILKKIIEENLYKDGSIYNIPLVLQEFLPDISKGDKRVLILDGEVLGCIGRKPQEGKIISNLASGGILFEQTLEKEEFEICEEIAQELKRVGIFFIGIDMINGKLIEINITSPTGFVKLQEIELNKNLTIRESLINNESINFKKVKQSLCNEQIKNKQNELDNELDLCIQNKIMSFLMTKICNN